MPDPARRRAGATIAVATPIESGSRAQRWAGLLVASGSGDEASFELLAREVRTLLHLHAQRILTDPADADEVVQDVLLEAWRNAGRYDPLRGRALTWMGQIVQHRAIDLIRKTAARRSRERRATVRSNVIDIDDTIEAVLTLADHATVRAALPCLTSLQREAVLLVYYRGLTISETANRLAVPVPTVKTRLRDGIGRLRVVVHDMEADQAG